jgi:hypothetical protein
VPGYSVQPDLAPRAHAEAKRARADVRARVVEARNEHNLARCDKMGRQRAGPHDSAPAFPRVAIALAGVVIDLLISSLGQCGMIAGMDSLRVAAFQRQPHARVQIDARCSNAVSTPGAT